MIRATIPRPMKAAENMYAYLRLATIGKLAFWKMVLEKLVVTFRLSALPRLAIQSTIRRVMNTAVKNEQAIPIISVIAKPFTGPEPKKYRIAATRNVVKLESKMEE